jgi:hypothetical protein
MRVLRLMRRRNAMTTHSNIEDVSLGVEETAEHFPIEVRRLLKSYALDALRWADPEHRNVIVLEILTRGEDIAQRWLWSRCTLDEARALVVAHGAGGQDNEARALLRGKLGLTERELPPRPFDDVPWRD